MTPDQLIELFEILLQYPNESYTDSMLMSSGGQSYFRFWLGTNQLIAQHVEWLHRFSNVTIHGDFTQVYLS